MKKISHEIKHLIKILVGKEILIRPQINASTYWFGNSNAGFYVYPNSIDSDSIVYSFGIGEDISFDEQLINEFNCSVYGFDPTPKSIQFINNKTISGNFVFKPVGIYSFDGNIEFYLPTNPAHVSCTTAKVWEYKNTKDISVKVPVKKFSTIVKELGHKKIEILKLDIEGSEYEVLDDILNSRVEINQILIEFHHRFPTIKKQKTKEAIKKLNSFGYKLAAISDQYEEFTFLKTKSE